MEHEPRKRRLHDDHERRRSTSRESADSQHSRLRGSQRASLPKRRRRLQTPCRAQRDVRKSSRCNSRKRDVRESSRCRSRERDVRESSRCSSRKRVVRDPSRCRSRVRRERDIRESSRYSSRTRQHRADIMDKRSVSPHISTNDVLKLIQTLTSKSQTPVNNRNNDYKNILPEFDPSTNNQRIDIWLKKVNECAAVYGWDDKTTIHFAMQKLQGLAKCWYESLSTILYSWDEWQVKLISAFPCEHNYGQSLEDMLRRKSRFNESIQNYFYEKLALINQCDITGKRAVDCIIHGISDRTMKSSALALRCSHPDQLLQFLMSNKDNTAFIDRSSNAKPRVGTEKSFTRTGFNQVQTLICYNCKEQGHSYTRCTKPLVRCSRCSKIGHNAEACLKYTSNPKENINTTHNKTMRISSSSPNAKYFKDVKINNEQVNAFIDFGSEVTVITQSLLTRLGLKHDNISYPMKGFGNDIVLALGNVKVELVVDGVSAEVDCKVVADKYLDTPLLIGQSFTEQPHILATKCSNKLDFFCVNELLPLYDNFDDNTKLIKLIIDKTVTLHGISSIRAVAQSGYDGYIFLDNRLIGKPIHPYFVNGGLYRCAKNRVNIVITPESSSCQITENTIIARAFPVQIINRIAPTVPNKDSIKNITDIALQDLRIGEFVCESDKLKLLHILNQYKHCFANSLQELGCTNVAEMNIEVNSKTPVVYRPYRLSHSEREKVRVMIDEMLEAGIIRDSTSEYASPIVLVRKKDGNQRLCIDYRMLNSVTVKERYPMPIIEDEIARLSGHSCFITLDLSSGYYQIPISEKSKKLTSFVTSDGQYEFNRMPFGLANAPAVFQRVMNKVLGSARFTEATAYIDDILIYGINTDDCINKLKHVLQLLENAKLTLNLNKCEFLCDKIDYLGYEISSEGVRPGCQKIDSVHNFPRPINQHGVRQYLGLVSYFRKFIQNFAQLSYPLSRLLKKDVPFTWTDEQENCFNELKHRLITRPILAIYNPSAETQLHTDASKIGVGGILMQRLKESDPFKPVVFYSRQTSPEEKNFHSYELETLAIICCLRKFRVYLIGKEFKIITDCSALRTTFTKRDLIPRIARWWLLLQEYQCTVEYRPGTRMTHVDALSRNPTDSLTTDELERYPTVMMINNEDWLLTLQLGDSELQRVKDILTSKIDAEQIKHISENYVIKDNRIYRVIDGDKNNVRWAVPKGARWQICKMNHDDIGHFGVEKTLERIKGAYWFPKMTRFIKKYVGACLHCAYAKKHSTNSEGQLHPITKIEDPFHTLHIDHLGPFIKSKKQNSYLLLIVDAFTKFVFIKPVRNTKTKTAIAILDEIFNVFRSPDRIISDRGTCFTSRMFKDFCVNRKIKHVLNAVASPQSNGQVERYNRTVLSALTAQNINCDERNWDEKVGKIQWGLNNTIQKTTGRTPAEIMFGTRMNSEVEPILNEVRNKTRDDITVTDIRHEVKDRIDKEQAKQKQYYDKNKRPARIYNEGDLVKITKTSFRNDGQSKKLVPPYVGPFRVVSVLRNDRYEISAIPGLTGSKNKRKSIVAASRMLPWVHIAALDVHNDDVNDNYNTDEVESIEDSNINDEN